MLSKELQQIDGQLVQLLRNDPWPDSIEPGYLRDAVRDYPLRGGKRLRPALLLWCCELLGGDAARAFPAAAAIEVGHNWTLVHDDIIDQDALRRGKPSCHTLLEARFLPHPLAARYGHDLALLCGDLQQGWANALLLSSAEKGVPPALVIELSRRFQRSANAGVISGEALDTVLPLRAPDSVEPAEIRRVFALKTGALLQFAAEAGAILALGAWDDPRIDRLSEFALHAGIAFQLRDDYLGIFGETAKLGKPIGGDLRERKATLLLVEALRRSTPEQRLALESLLGRAEYADSDMKTARRLFRECGAADAVLSEAEMHWDHARAILYEFPENAARKKLLAFVELLAGRES